MMKFKIIFVFAIFFSFSVQAGYVRKLREPDFFIPEGQQMHRQEKLPPVNRPVLRKKDVEKKEIYTEIPEYKKKYENYLADISFFVKNNEMPENAILENDLKAMETGDVFEVIQSVPENVTTKEHKEFELLVQEILNN